MPNEITALIGPSGSGKSTLLKAINHMGDLDPEVTTTGTVIYNGHKPSAVLGLVRWVRKKLAWSSSSCPADHL